MLPSVGRWHQTCSGSTSTAPRLCYLPASAAFSYFSYASNPPNTHVGVSKLKIATQKKNAVQSESWFAAELFIPTYPSHPKMIVPELCRCSLSEGQAMPGRDNTLAGVCPLDPLSARQILFIRLFTPTATWKHLKSPPHSPLCCLPSLTTQIARLTHLGSCKPKQLH